MEHPEKEKDRTSDEVTIAADAPPHQETEHQRHQRELEAVVKEYVEPDHPKVDYGENPDGGLRAWLVVIGCAAGTCGTFGLVNAWGVFQAYYQQSILPGTSTSTISWIGSVQYALVFLPGLVVGRLFDMGYLKSMLGAASAVLVAATFLTAQCTQYWQFLLCQGIALGLACGVIFGTIVAIPAHWFKHKLGAALGVMALGSSVGGTLFPIAVKNLVQQVGFQWTMRILGFLEILLLGFQFVTVERRLPPKPRSGPFVDLTAFKDIRYLLYSLSSLVSFFGLYTVLTYLDVAAVQQGISDNLAFYLLSIANACSAVGRVVGGLVADRWTGPLNIMIPATFLAGIMTYVWPFVNHTVGGNIGIAIVYGASSGVYVSLLAAPIVRISKVQEVGVRAGMSFTLVAVGGIAGPPISGAIQTVTGGFKDTGIYAGSAVMVAVAFMFAARYAILGGLWGRV
ncbi:MFS general substrate transporter [Epithele typhae]|uniref:MFS general substrate transporter n=1 Tax=Epithele typhae TaxID=378194 RepID=UPI002007FDCE|nr:MFS general substrate transporter [Epithele typhae]KAH9928564.1 MFS general substrate transporter [Epithele typhae]